MASRRAIFVGSLVLFSCLVTGGVYRSALTTSGSREVIDAKTGRTWAPPPPLSSGATTAEPVRRTQIDPVKTQLNPSTSSLTSSSRSSAGVSSLPIPPPTRKNLGAPAGSTTASIDTPTVLSASAVRLKERLQRHFDRYGLDDAQRDRVVAIFFARGEDFRDLVRTEDILSAGLVKENFLQQQLMMAKLAEEFGAEIAARLYEARHSLPYHTAFVNDLVRRSLEAGEPLSVDTADNLAIALTKTDIYVRMPRPASFPPRPALPPERLARITSTNEKALDAVAPMLTPVQQQLLKQIVHERLLAD